MIGIAIVFIIIVIACFMFLLIRWAVSCHHKWAILDTERIYNKDDRWIRTNYVMRCEKCGELKSKEL